MQFRLHSHLAIHALFLHAVYLAISLPPVVFPVRQVLDAWLPGPVDKHPFLRKCFLIAVITIIYMLVGLLAPDSSAQVKWCDICTASKPIVLLSLLIHAQP